MLNILGRPNSSNVQKVLWGAAEMEIPFNREDYGGQFDNTHDEAYLSLNPNEVVPTIIDSDSDYDQRSGFVLWESNAILRYLAHKHRKLDLYPDDPQQRALVEQWLDWQQTTIGPAITPVFWGLVRTPPEQRDMQRIRDAAQKTQHCFEILDRQLASSAYVAGNGFTLADIPLGITAYRWFEMDVERKPMMQLERWYKALCVRPAYRQWIMTGLT